jgi:hypothetical protein
MKSLFFLLILLGSFWSGFAQTTAIIPEPVSCQMENGTSLKTDQIKFFCQPGQEFLIRNFSDQLAGFGIRLQESQITRRKTANLILEKVSQISGKEA